MAKPRRSFKMKQFEVTDFKSANKIGVDGVMIASWCGIPPQTKRILDVGCGCGIMTLMLAQRAKNAHVDGIDVDPEAVEEAISNVRNSQFAARINIYKIEFNQFIEEKDKGLDEVYDLIVSNPPFFNSGVDPTESKRMLARHSGTLSPEILISRASECLAQSGHLSFIAPSEYLDNYLKLAAENGLLPEKICFIRGNPQCRPKRVMLTFRKVNNNSEGIKSSTNYPEPELVTIETERGEYTPEYIALGRPFYLKF